MKSLRKLALLVVLLCFSTAAAQDSTCGPFVQKALDAVQADCATTGRNQACYGYVALDATPREGVQEFNFAAAGDLADVADVQTLRLSELNEAEDTWGIALMKLQANLPDTLPGQNVTFLMFGNVEIQNAVPAGTEPATDQVTARSNINVRSGPSTNYGVIGSLRQGDTATANGRSQDSSWLRIQIPGSSALGWVSTPLVTPTGDVAGLSAVEASDTEAPFKPMQAFYFSTGISQSSCEDAPQDGILIQTPEGAGKIALRANDVDIELGSTGYLQAEAGQQMTVSVVEGQGEITADGKTVIVPAGAQVDIPVDENLSASGAPGEVRPYDPAEVAHLPIKVLPRNIEIAPPAEEERIQQENNPGSGGPGGFGGAIAAFGFCEALKQSGMSPSEYLAAIEQSQAMLNSGAVEGVDMSQIQASIDQTRALVAACQ